MNRIMGHDIDIIPPEKMGEEKKTPHNILHIVQNLPSNQPTRAPNFASIQERRPAPPLPSQPPSARIPQFLHYLPPGASGAFR